MTPELSTALSRVNETAGIVRVTQIELGEALTRLREGNPFHFYFEAQERFNEASDAHYEALAVVDGIMERRAADRKDLAA